MVLVWRIVQIRQTFPPPTFPTIQYYAQEEELLSDYYAFYMQF